MSYGCDRSGIIALLGEELSASAWTHGESDAGPTIEVRGRKLEDPPSAEDIEYLESIATPAPYPDFANSPCVSAIFVDD